MRLLFGSLLCTSLFFQPCDAAEISAPCGTLYETQAGCSISVQGPIVRGDAQRLRDVLARPPGGPKYLDLVLDSPGGNVDEAFEIVGIVRAALLETRNYQLGASSFDKQRSFTCASACVLVLIGGVERGFLLSNGGRLGIHRPSFDAATYRPLTHPIAHIFFFLMNQRLAII
jgi:hypothetical protein